MHIFDKGFQYIRCQIKFTLRLTKKHSMPLVEINFSTTQQMPPKYLFGQILPLKMRENKYLKTFHILSFQCQKLAYHQMTCDVSPTTLIITYHFSKLKRRFLFPKNGAAVSFLNNFIFKNLNPKILIQWLRFCILPPKSFINSGLLTPLYFSSSSCHHLHLFVFLLLKISTVVEYF